MKLFWQLLIAIALLFPFSIEAKSPTYVKFGMNISSLRNEEGLKKPGICIGIEKEFYPIRTFNVFLGIGVDYQRRKVVLKNRTWKSNIFVDDSEIESANIDVDVSYLDIPLKLGYSTNVCKNFNLNIYTGCSISIPIKNRTNISNQTTLPLTPDERKDYKYDYIILDENIIIPSTNLHLGIILRHNRYLLNINFLSALSKTEGITSLNIEDNFDCFEFSFGFLF